MIAGLDWVAAHAIHPAVANLSYSGNPGSFGVRDALEGVASSGVAVTKAAGNENRDAFEDRGNRAVGAMIVGATTAFDQRASFSNFGSTITLFAPGVDVKTADNASNSAVNVVGGKSIAANRERTSL